MIDDSSENRNLTVSLYSYRRVQASSNTAEHVLRGSVE